MDNRNLVVPFLTEWEKYRRPLGLVMDRIEVG